MPLRQFLYYDQQLVEDFLAELEGGRSDEERQRQERSRSGGAGANVGFGGVGARAGGDASGTREFERTVRQVRASNFERLFRLLTEDPDPLLREVFELDDNVWSEVRRGDLVAVDMSPVVPPIALMFDDPENATSLAETAGVEMDEETRQTMAAINQLGQVAGSGGQLTVVGEAAGASGFNFLCRLKKNDLTVSLDELTGECTVVGKVQRKVREDEREPLMQVPGMALLPPVERAQLMQSLVTDDDPSVVMRGPGAVLTVVAMYR